MANEKIEIEIVLDDGSIAKGFAKIDKQGQKTGMSLKNAFTGALAVFASLRGLSSILNTLRQYEKSFAEINTITNLTTESQKRLNNQLIATSAQFGTTAQSQAKSFYQIISAGVTDTVKANELLIASNKLAIGGLASQASSIDILTSAVNSFGQENLSAGRAADILFGTVKLGKTNVEQLSSSLGQILPSASALGVSFEDTNAALATLTTRGVSTSEAVTQLNAIFTAVLKKQGEAKKILGESSDAFSLQALKTKGLAGFLKDLNNALGGSEEKLVKLTGRAEGARAVITLAGDNFKSLERNVVELKNSLGSADKAFAIINQSLDQKINKSTAKTEAIFLKLAQTTSGPLSTALDFLNQQLDDILSSFDLFANFDEFIQASMGVALVAIIDFAIAAVEVLSSIPFIGDRIAGALGDNLVSGLEAQKQRYTDAVLSLLQAPAEVIASGENPLKPVNDAFDKSSVQMSESMIRAGESINTSFRTGVMSVISVSVQTIGRSLVKGASAFDDFGKAVLNIIGDMAIQIGTTLIGIGLGIDALKLSLGTLTGGVAIAAGIALVAIGGALKALGGGGLSVASSAQDSSNPAGDTSAIDDLSSDQDVERGQAVTVNLNGVITDPIGTATQIAQLLSEITDSNDIAVNA